MYWTNSNDALPPNGCVVEVMIQGVALRAQRVGSVWYFFGVRIYAAGRPGYWRSLGRMGR